MATEKRLIDANKIYDAVERRYQVSSGIEHRCERDLLDLICSADTVDAVEVVRCKDCKHYLWHDWDYSYCCIKLGKFVKPDFGCLYGERKSDE